MSRRDFLKAAALGLAGLGVGRTDAVRQPFVKPFKFLVFTDIHYLPGDWTNDTPEFLEKVLARAERENCQMVIQLGDMIHGVCKPSKRVIDDYLKIYNDFKVPSYHVMGNHDTDVLTKDEFFAHVSNTGFAAAQGYYSFVRGGVKFIVLDANFNSDSDSDHFSRGNWTWSVAYIPPAERAWLEAELAAATCPVVVFCHQRLDGTGSYFVKNAAEVRRIIEKSRKVIGVFAGHEHSGGRNCMNGVSYYTLRSLAESGQSFEVACYPNGISVFGHGINGG